MKKKYESGKLHGVYRCAKRAQVLEKIPKIDKPEIPNLTDIILSGIMNLGNDPSMIRIMAKECIGYDNIKIPYNEITSAKNKFIKEVIAGKLTNTLHYSVESLVNTFYEFVDTPTDATKALLVKSDIRDINRYLECENRNPIIIGHPLIKLYETEFECQCDFLFVERRTIKINKRKEGRRYVYDEADATVVECVKLIPGKPKVKETSKLLDVSTTTRLEMYIMLKSLEKWCHENNKTSSDIMLRASYYYLQKDRETDDNYSDNFFEKGGNVVSLQIWLKNVKQADSFFEPQLKTFLNGMSVSSEECKDCSSKVFCKYYDSAKPLEQEMSMPQCLPSLSQPQNEAANALTGNIRVIATAGSGKTTTMAYRIMNLLKAGVMPEKIGCFTFTNAGAREMADRIKGFCRISGIAADVDKITISTIHSFGDTILKKYYQVLGYENPPVIINEIQKTKIVESILHDNLPIEEFIDKYKNFYMDMFRAKGILEFTKDLFGRISEGMTIEDLIKDYKISEQSAHLIFNMYKQYEKYKHDMCLIEHNDQELGVLKLLKLKPDLFDEIGIEHISVDEFQDTSNIQFEIINAMRHAKCVKSLFIVGDDDQSIYGFRSANVRLIQDFFDMIGEPGKDISLMENRRSTGQIVKFADAIIANNSDRISKHPVSVKEDGADINVLNFDSKDSEQAYIVNTIDSLIKSGINDKDIAILTATNSELLVFADMLKAKGIDSISINPEPLLENPRVRGAIALVKFMNDQNEFNGMAFMNARENGQFISKSSDEIKTAVESLAEDVKNIKTVTELFDWFSTIDPEDVDEIYQSFLNDIKTAEANNIEKEDLTSICQYILDFERFGQKQTARREKVYNGVVLSTMHSSKGKEWPIVFCSVTKLHTRNLQQDEIPEKNRLLFVACTRAREGLYITGVNCENMFLDECMKAQSI